MNYADFDHIKPSANDNPARAVVAIMETTEERAHKLLRVMLDGHRVSRLNCDHFGIASWNSSVHSAVSFIENSLDIPVSRERIGGGHCEYWLAPEVIRALNKPEERQRQAISFRRETTARRQHKRIQGYLKLLSAVNEYPALLDSNPLLIQSIRKAYNETADFLAKNNRRDKVSTAATNDIFETLKKSEVSGNE